MSDEHPHGARNPRWLLAVGIALAIATFVLAFLGWLAKADDLNLCGPRVYENAAFMAFRAFGFDEAYGDAQLISNWQLVLARWGGFTVVASTLVTAGLAVFRSQIAALWADLRSHHTLIVGDHEMAAALVDLAVRAKTPVTHVSALAVQPKKAGSLITLPRPVGGDALLSGGAARARRVVVAETDMGASIEQGLQALKKSAAATSAAARIAVHLDDPIIAERIHHAPGGANLFAFSEAQAAARSVMLRHPPFLLARRIKASAVHVLIVGFGRLGQAVARDVVLNCITSDLGPPHVTVVHLEAEAARAEFLHKHPEFCGEDRFQVMTDLDQAKFAEDKPQICAVYICLRDSAEALSTAIIQKERASRHDLIQGPIFVRLRSGGPLRPDSGVASLKPRQIYSFGALSDAAASSAALADDPDADAKRVHEVYARTGGYSATPWAELSEELRVSNRRVISHVPAKLASLGFDLEAWLTQPDAERRWPPALAPGEALYRDEDERRSAAILEHERWMADRRVNGWRYGTARDNERKVQPYLVPFDALPKDVQAFDFAIADWLADYVQARPDGVLRRAAP